MGKRDAERPGWDRGFCGVGTSSGAGPGWGAELGEAAGRCQVHFMARGQSAQLQGTSLSHPLPALPDRELAGGGHHHPSRGFQGENAFQLLQDDRKVSRCLFKQVCLNRKIQQTGSYFSFSTFTIFEMISKDIFSHNWTVSGYQPFDQIGAFYVVSHQRASKLQIKAGFRFCL